MNVDNIAVIWEGDETAYSASFSRPVRSLLHRTMNNDQNAPENIEELEYLKGPMDFGENGDYWAVYDRISDTKDMALLNRLNRNLDILLIFVSILHIGVSMGES